MEDLIENEDVQTIGEMLRNARIKQNKTIDEIADELYIRKFYLNAIENMDFANIPPMPYCLGFVRSYAKILGLNSDRIVASYKQILTGENEPKQHLSGEDKAVSYPRMKHIILGILGLALLAVAWSVLPITSKFEDISEDTSMVLPKPVIVSEETEKKVEKKLAVEKEASKAKKMEKNETDIKSNTDEKQVNENKKEDKTKTDENSASDEKIKDDKKVEDDGNKKKEENKADKVLLPKMKIVLSGPSWLELRQGKKVILNGVYNKGYKYDFPSEKGLILTVGRPRNVQFYLDEKPITVATNIKRKNISLDSYFKTQD
ncbi:MAG: DUF4115 domain-containing protein [Alphaproteobacteria bacterium]|nr:DUF4115 domain-containing protein [Alphaproteobacteria bacterium]